MTSVEAVLRRAAADLDEIGRGWALVGGLAVSVRTRPRFTQDVDLAVAAADDHDAESVAHAMRMRGYSIVAVLEQAPTSRLATVRLVQAGEDEDGGVIVDLMFASSGIEPEVVAAATRVHTVSDLVVPVACTGHLIALKVLARDDDRRPQDIADLKALLRVADAGEMERARSALRLIESRGFHRERDLIGSFDALAGQPR